MLTACAPAPAVPPPPVQPAAGACPSVTPRVMLVCGADVLNSMADPTMWRQDLLEVGGRCLHACCRPACQLLQLSTSVCCCRWRAWQRVDLLEVGAAFLRWIACSFPVCCWLFAAAAADAGGGGGCTPDCCNRNQPASYLPEPRLFTLAPPPQTLLSQHGVVCVSRAGSDTPRLLDRPGTLLNTYRRNIALVEEPVPNEISSSRVGGWVAGWLVVDLFGFLEGSVGVAEYWACVGWRQVDYPALAAHPSSMPASPCLPLLPFLSTCRCGTSWSRATPFATSCLSQ